MNNYLKCNKCGWTHFGMSRADCEDGVAKFNEMFNNLSEEKQDSYYGGFITDEKGKLVKDKDGNYVHGKAKPASLESYLKCFKCRNTYKDFRVATKEELAKISGSTIQPIMIFEG